MTGITLLSRSATTFGADGAFDENAYRRHLQRYVDSNLGVLLASGGSGEGFGLLEHELRHIYEVGVDVCKGKVPVGANPPEPHTSIDTIAYAKAAIAAGVEFVCVYGPGARHDYKPNAVEYKLHMDTVLSALEHPVALAPNPLATGGFTPAPELIASLVNTYEHVTTVILNLSELEDLYLFKLQRSINRPVRYHVPLRASFHGLGNGAAGLLGNHANVIPQTFRRYMDLYESGSYQEMNVLYAKLRLFDDYVYSWGISPIWIKMAMKAFDLPGAAGGVRPPFVLPPDDKIQEFARGLLGLGIDEIDDMARAVGMDVPALTRRAMDGRPMAGP
jgi:dihydrodipicolinate synthase/N-acetylneuraminate lyase